MGYAPSCRPRGRAHQPEDIATEPLGKRDVLVQLAMEPTIPSGTCHVSGRGVQAQPLIRVRDSGARVDLQNLGE